MSGYVYAVRCQDYIKVGFSTKPLRRARGMSTDTPFKIELLGFRPGTLEDEGQLHERFAGHHHRAEWFRAEGAVLEFVGTLKRPRDFLFMDKRKAKRTPEQLAAWRTAYARSAERKHEEYLSACRKYDAHAARKLAATA